MPEIIQEFVNSSGQQLRVDREAGVLRGVKLLGLVSQNRRRYRESALAGAVRLYEGAKVNVNHPKGSPLAPRDYQDRLGVIRAVAFRPGEGLFGDLHFNPKHALGEQLMWDAEHEPANVGLSHNVLARTSRDGNHTVVEAISKVQSVDLVADPATTRGLFEQLDEDQEPVPTPIAPHDGKPVDIRWDVLTIEQLELHRPDLVAELQRGLRAECRQYREQLDQVAASEAAARRRHRIAELLSEHHLPLPDGDDCDAPAEQIVSHQFIASLMRAPDDAALRKLVEERASLVHAAQRWSTSRGLSDGRPISRDQLAVVFPPDAPRGNSAAEFAAAIRV